MSDSELKTIEEMVNEGKVKNGLKSEKLEIDMPEVNTFPQNGVKSNGCSSHLSVEENLLMRTSSPPSGLFTLLL